VELAGFLLYLGCKFAAYVAWCSLGARLHGHREGLLWRGIVLGIVRLMMGAVLGLIAIVALLNLLAVTVRDTWQLYLLVYVPVRWVEWSLMVPMLDKQGPSLRGLVVGRTPSSAYWRLGGIALSCLADIPMMVSMGSLPIGRFMC
jgi:hypothetical protein